MAQSNTARYDEGNVLSLTILTMEEVPKKILVNTKEELVKYIHSYGISGIILEARMALAKKTEWVDVLVSFNELEHALLFSGEVANSEIIKKRLVSVCEAPLSSVYPPLTSFTNEKQATVLLQIAPEHTHHIQELAATYEGETSDLFSGYVKEKQLRITDFSWNHVTLWWLKQHSEDTYLQGRFNPVTYLDQVRQLKKRYSDEVLIHFEWIKVGGVVVPSSQPVIRFTTIERLQEIILSFEEFGIKVSNPHTYLLEEGGKDDWIDLICQAKQDNDPFDLLNPGKTNRFVRLLRAGDIHV
ncbi:FAD-binding oxidoreductase [Halalkalibacter akibai]|uniref:Putative FAD-binding dehydrogenase n=1 Tax=Halalkalibacter akibai (strain ATCC 43226 / DSM 21942 / CIP 109018 / JCM 9157 / 1139) TaxID=1236973 RepID=W4QM17_HALA3|nr:FAD-binding oxidoreductase [Halalkalibacter akibai]GAE33136.1 putative FAD-binding dehydrogenase [Halalkalibacter akibai JCM 9157]